MHEFIIDRYGGTQGVISVGSLESALARPFSGYYHAGSTQAAALMHALIKNHPFLDGNKRTAVLATLVSLDISGYQVTHTRQFSRIDRVAEQIADNRYSQAELETFFRRRMRPKPPWAAHGVHEFGRYFNKR